MPVLVSNATVMGNTAPNVYADYKPWAHASGVARWILDDEHYTHTLEGLHIRQRTQAEIEATSEWIAWNRQQEIEADSAASHVLFQTLPNWLKTFTTADVEAYVETNVTSLATAKVALTHLGKAVVVVRDYLKLRQ